MLALQPRILQRRDVFETAARLRDHRIGRAVIGIGALHQIVALRKAHDDVAAMRAERHPHEAGRLRESTCSRASSAVLRRTARRACSRTPRPFRSRTAGCADRRRPAAPWDRPVRSTDRAVIVGLRTRTIAADKHCDERKTTRSAAQRLAEMHVVIVCRFSVCDRSRPVKMLASHSGRATGMIFAGEFTAACCGANRPADDRTLHGETEADASSIALALLAALARLVVRARAAPEHPACHRNRARRVCPHRRRSR